MAWRIRLKADLDITIEKIKKEKLRLVILNARGEETTMETIAPDMKIVVSAALTRTTPTGPKPARADGDLVWTADKPGIVGLFPLNGGLTCEITNIGPGTCVVTCEADADLTAAVRKLTASLDITCVEGEADTLTLTPGPNVPL